MTDAEENAETFCSSGSSTVVEGAVAKRQGTIDEMMGKTDQVSRRRK